MDREISRRAGIGLVVVLALAAGVLTGVAPAYAAGATTSGDASVTYDATTSTWTMITSKVKRVVQLSGGNYRQTSLVDLSTGHEYQQSGATSEFRVRVDGATDFRGSTGGWNLDGQSSEVQLNGSIHLIVQLSTDDLGITRHYWVYPETSFIEERTDVTNKTSEAKTLTDYSAISMRVLGSEASNVDLYNMSGDKATSGMKLQTLQGPYAMTSGVRTFGGSGANGYQPLLALRNRQTNDGLIATWDFTGNWSTTVGDNYGKLLVEPRATLATALASGATISGPTGRIGFFEGDLDDMGNAVLDFTYRYLWDDTSEEYVPLIRYGGYGSDPTTILNKTRQLAYIGGDMVWMDDGWQDAMGDWNAKEDEPLTEYRDFAAQSGLQVGYWLVPWGAEGSSQLAQQHPDWMVNVTNRKAGLDTTNPDVVTHIDEVLQQKQNDFGPFMLKTDFGADSGNLEKANATVQILEDFVKNNPAAGLQLCSDGGGLMNLYTVSLSDLALLRDGVGGKEEGYWTSLLYPAEKLIMSYGRGNIGAYDKSNRHLLSFHLTIAGDTNAGPEALEPLRIDAELYRYLASQEVMGRWVKIYRPTVQTGSAEGIIQKMSGDGERGYITFPKSAFGVGSTVTLFPKGLEADRTYTVASQEGSVPTATKTGADWMAAGITMAAYVEGEVVYFNLEDRPGAGTDATAPTSPSLVQSTVATHLGEDGVDVTWAAGSDDRWISYYEIFRNGSPVSKVSVGEYFFDPDASEGDEYSVRTVDGDGNTSAVVAEGDSPNEAPTWDAGAIYDAGDEVVYDDDHYVAAWWTQGATPGEDPNGAWQHIIESQEGDSVWSPSRIFLTGEEAVYAGVRYRALWWNRNQQPGQEGGAWAEIVPSAGSPAAWTTTTIYDFGDLVTHDGLTYRAKWWTRSDTPGVATGPWEAIN